MSRQVHEGERNGRSRIQWVRDIALAVLLAAAGPAAVTYGPAWADVAQAYAEPDRAAVRTLMQQPAVADRAGDLLPVYAARNYAPLWFTDHRPRPEVYEALDLLESATGDGLNPERYRARGLRIFISKATTPEQQADADVRLSTVWGDYITDLHTPVADAEMIYTDPSGAPPAVTRRGVMAQVAAAPAPHAAMVEVRRMNPFYRHLRQSLADHRARTSVRGDEAELLILANLERARALPADMGRRFVFVDVPAGELRLYEDGEVRDRMKVVVGKTASPTPVMAGLIRYAAYNPYWNIPPDLTRETYAPRILAEPSTLTSMNLEVLTGDTIVSDPAALDWQAVSDGRLDVRLRQKPGGANMMGAVKFMLPNALGIYLHDTPNKAAFKQADRALSAGCVRLEDASRLSRWLFGAPPVLTGLAEEHVDLIDPVPVYITYFTAPYDAPTSARRDLYGRDKTLLAAVAASQRGILLKLGRMSTN